MGRVLPAVPDNEGQFLRANPRMVRGLVTEPAIPAEGPDETDRAAGDEDAAPAEPRLQRRDQGRRQAAGEKRAREENALNPPALADGNPSRERPRRVRPRARFAGAEQEADDEHHDEARGETGRHGER